MTALAFLTMLWDAAHRTSQVPTVRPPAYRYSRQPDGTYLEERI